MHWKRKIISKASLVFISLFCGLAVYVFAAGLKGERKTRKIKFSDREILYSLEDKTKDRSSIRIMRSADQETATKDSLPVFQVKERFKKGDKPKGYGYFSQGVPQAPTGDVLLTFSEGAGEEMIIQVSVPDFEVKEKFEKGGLFQVIKLKGYGYTSQVGKPQLPTKGLLLAIPEGSELEVEVLKSEKVSKFGYNIYPVPKLVVKETDEGMMYTVEEFTLDRAAYSSHQHYPERLAEVGSYGYLRDLKVAQLRVFPLQYNPAKGELLFHKRIWLKVKLIGGKFPCREKGKGKSLDKKNPFEAIYRNLILNYNSNFPGTGSMGGRMEIPEMNLDYLGNNSYKISVEEDGLYESSYQGLSDAGVNLEGVDPRTIRIFNLGEEIPIFIYGEEDGVFDTTDYVEFFGLGNISEYSFSNIYWLSWGGGFGLRMGQRDCSPGDSLPVPTSFLQKFHFEEDHRYYSNVYYGEGKDHWFWEQLNAPCTKTYPITLPDICDTSADIPMRINIRGKSYGSHHTQVSINGNLIADLYWSGAIELESSFTCPQSYLNSGDNQLEIKCPSSSLDQIFFNWFEIEYWRGYTAYEDYLRFLDSGSGPNQFEISGFSDNPIELFQITDPNQVIRLVDYSVVPGDSTYTLIFEDSFGQEEYLTLTSDQRRAPAFIIKDEFSDLRSPANGADYIIITHEDFYDSIHLLKDLRQAEGLRVKMVKIGDVYDEFSYGNLDPQAIKDFLAYTYYNWQQPAPSYVLLVGDASFDYRGNIPGGNINYVPTHLFVSQSDWVEISSDDWFVYLVGDDLLPEMLIGRLSAQTQAEVEGMVEKIIGYETSIPPGDWRRNVLLVCDNADEGGDFPGICENFANNYIIPAGFQVTWCCPGSRQCIIKTINDGCVICNYVGHGAIDQWAGERMFQSSDVSALSNGGKLPLVVSYTCLNGFFHHATDDYCLAEEFTRPQEKGAISCWSHSGLDYASCSEIIGCCLYDALLNDGNYILGSAVCQAKLGYLATSPYFWDQAEMLILFGDPALGMDFLGKPDLLPGSIAFRPLRPEAGESDTIIALIYNAGREDADSLMIRFSHGHPDSSGAEVIADVVIPHLQAGEHIDAWAIWDSVPDVGAYPIFVQVDPQDQILESNEWNNILWDTLRVDPPDAVGDIIPPIIELFIDGKTVGVDFQHQDYVPSNPKIEALLRDDKSGINTKEIQVTLNQKPIDNFQIDHQEIGANIVRLRYLPKFLPDGSYILAVSVRDCSKDNNFAQASATFIVESKLKITNVRNYPNPCRGKISFTYSLSQDARDVTIKIYSITGRLIKTIHHTSGYRNYNLVNWDGRDGDGNSIANGVYLYQIIARSPKGRNAGRGKLVVLR